MLAGVMKGRGTEAVHLSGDEIEFIASNPKEYREHKEFLTQRLEDINTAKNKLTKAENLDKLITSAETREKEAIETLKQAQSEKKSIVEKVKHEALGIKGQAQTDAETQGNETKRLEKEIKALDIEARRALNVASNLKKEAENKSAATTEAYEEATGLKQLLIDKIAILTKACREAGA